jgi:2-methylcitrate dehydratase PrpD
MDIQKLMSRIERQYDPTIQPAENAAPAGRFTIIEIDTVNGQSYRSRIDIPKGSPNNPVTFPELKEKLYQSVCQDSLSSQLLQVITELEDTPDLQKLITLL